MQPTVLKLTKVLELEQRQGHRNEAVIGGFEAFVPVWQAEAGREVPEAIVAAVGRLAEYGDLAEAERRIRVSELLSLARNAVDAPPEVSDTSARSHRPNEPDSKPPADQPLQSVDDAELERPVVHLRGIGRKSAENLERLGIRTIRDMLFHMPVRYNDYSRLVPIGRLSVDDEVTVVGAVLATNLRDLGGKRSVLNVTLSDSTGEIHCSFFNQPYLEREFHQGRRIVVSGRVESWAGRLALRSPEWEPIERKLTHTGRLVPVYPLTHGVSQRWLRRQIKHVVESRADLVGDPLPARVRAAENLPTLPDALRELHFPESYESQVAALGRLEFDELLVLQLWSRRRRLEWLKKDGVNLSAGRATAGDLTGALPFELTGAQRRAIDQIAADMSRDVPMSRLLQGDVGSGKTVVAAAALAMANGAGFQAAIMAPTEILAEQHAVSLARLLEPLGYEPYRPDEPSHQEHRSGRPPRLARLVGSMTPSAKAATATAAATGAVDIVVGTHAVIQDSVQFARLGLAVIDEQHRFGVLQRAALPQRALDPTAGSGPAPVPHVLIMTATPIPRTLAQVLAADLDQSVIDELPPGRKPIKTSLLTSRDRERAYQVVRHRASRGEQAYVVFPLVEESDAVAARAAVAEHERLAAEVLPGLRVGLLHGRMPASDKEAVMASFKSGDIDVLVATSVIEVGVDVPNATIMVIDGADRFGLAQLHQFRGRVGRGTAESVCLLIADEPSETAQQRLEALTTTSDGLELALIDLDMRGPGDYFGLRQSGLMEYLRFARLASTPVMTSAARVAADLMQSDPELESDDLAAIRARVDQFTEAAERI
ncbi:MAG: ATP-dependent DNA helicase RecG [Anaerolineae bacterium]